MPPDLSLSLPLMKSIGNEESRVKAVVEDGGGGGVVMVRGCLWYSPIPELSSVACNFLLVANYELAPPLYPACLRLSLGSLVDRKWDLNSAPAGLGSVLTEVTDRDGETRFHIARCCKEKAQHWQQWAEWEAPFFPSNSLPTSKGIAWPVPLYTPNRIWTGWLD
jgi:hypothetical protein